MPITADATSMPNSLSVAQFPIPIQRMYQGKRSQVMEVLKVRWHLSSGVVNNNTFVFDASVGTRPPNASVTVPASISDPGVIDVLSFANGGTAGVSLTNGEGVIDHDLTDGAGHGMILATDNFYLLWRGGSGSGNAGFISAVLVYRWKNIGLQEYLGVVQEQQ